MDFTADGLRLRGTLHVPQTPAPPVIIGCHGLLSDRMSPKQLALADACTRLGMAYFRFDHRGCGQSEGPLEGHTRLEARCSDLLHAIRHLAGRSDLGRRIGLFGSSLGGAVCLLAAGQAAIAATVTFAAPVRRPELATITDKLKTDFDLAPVLPGIRNILIFHGEADEVVPVAAAHEIYQYTAPPKRLILQTGGDHRMSDPRHQAEFMREASAWFKKALDFG